MSITLGRTVERLTVWLVPSDPFVCELIRDDGQPWVDLPALDVGAQTWQSTAADAVIDGTTRPGAAARFEVPADAVDTALADTDHTARLTLAGMVWAVGTVMPGA